MDPSGAQILALSGTVMVSLMSAFTGYRLKNGRVDSSDAAQLWREAAAIRQDYARQISELRLEIHQRDERIASLENEKSRLEQKVHDLQIEVARLNKSAEDSDYHDTER